MRPESQFRPDRGTTIAADKTTKRGRHGCRPRLPAPDSVPVERRLLRVCAILSPGCGCLALRHPLPPLSVAGSLRTGLSHRSAGRIGGEPAAWAMVRAPAAFPAHCTLGARMDRDSVAETLCRLAVPSGGRSGPQGAWPSAWRFHAGHAAFDGHGGFPLRDALDALAPQRPCNADESAIPGAGGTVAFRLTAAWLAWHLRFAKPCPKAAARLVFRCRDGLAAVSIWFEFSSALSGFYPG